MRTPIRVAAAAAAASPAFANASSPAGAVFVQTDNTAGNRVVAYDRAADGTLTPAGAGSGSCSKTSSGRCDETPAPAP